VLTTQVATWPVDLDARRALSALQLLGWGFRLDAPEAGGTAWTAAGTHGTAARRGAGATAGAAVDHLLAVIAEHELAEPGWHVVVRRPGDRYPRDLSVVAHRDDAIVRGRILLARHVGCEGFVVRFSPALAMVELLGAAASPLRTPAGVPADGDGPSG